MTSAAIYARVSTSNGSQTCENQLLELRRYCEARGWKVHSEYTDVRENAIASNWCRAAAEYVS